MIRKLLEKFKKKPYDPSEIARGLGVKIGEDCRIYDSPQVIFGSEPWLIKVGAKCTITQGVKFLTHEGGIGCLRNLYPEEYANKDFFAPIIMGDNVFIGMYSIVMPGVTIGDNCIIGAHSVVTKDIPSNSVVVGTPARRLCSIEEYKEKQAKKDLVPTKNMNIEQKKEYLKNTFPQWFE